jgi:hypothetical protein
MINKSTLAFKVMKLLQLADYSFTAPTFFFSSLIKNAADLLPAAF